MIWNLVIIGIIFLIGFLINHIIEFRKLKFDKCILERQIEEIRSHFELYKRLSTCDSSQVKALEKKNAELLMENMQLRSAISAYRNVYGGVNQNISGQVPKGTIDAVKYAMKHAHPDNGGSAEDFVRFKKVYEQLTSK